jgi:hypothetical protein
MRTGSLLSQAFGHNPTGREAVLQNAKRTGVEDLVRVDVPREMLPKVIAKDTFYQRMLLLRPGQFGLTIAVRDVKGDRVGIWRRDLQVPEYKQGRDSHFITKLGRQDGACVCRECSRHRALPGGSHVGSPAGATF